jgi:hypothetical protein
MNSFGMYKGNKFQDRIREKLLTSLNAMIHGDEATTTVAVAGMLYSAAFYDGMSPFKDQLDLHNQCLLSNVKYQSDRIFETLKSRITERRENEKKV